MGDPLPCRRENEDTENMNEENNMTRKDFLASLGSIALGGTSLSLFPWLTACSPEKQKQSAGESVKLVILLNDARQTVDTSPKVGVPANDVIRTFHFLQHYRIPCKITVISSGDTLIGSSISTPFPLMCILSSE